MNNLALSCVGLMEANFEIDSPIAFFRKCQNQAKWSSKGNVKSALKLLKQVNLFNQF